MSATTAIGWTDATWNPLRGCSKISTGCQNCYAERIAAAWAKPGQSYEGTVTPRGLWNGRVRIVDTVMFKPLGWREPRNVFVNSMSDLFHEAVPRADLDRVVAVMAGCPQHWFQALTKRATRMREYLNDPATEANVRLAVAAMGLDATFDWPLQNVIWGVSIEDQRAAESRLPDLNATAGARYRMLSVEPLVGRVQMARWLAWRKIHWVVIGGESGPGHREMNLRWLAEVVLDCDCVDVPCYVKQDSGEEPGLRGRIEERLWARKRIFRADLSRARRAQQSLFS